MIAIKVYNYKSDKMPHGQSFYYLTIDGIQFGSVMFSRAEAEKAKERMSR